MFIKWINNERIGSSYTVYHFLLYIVFVWVSHLSSWINKSFRARTMWSIFISLTTAYPNSYCLNKWAKLLKIFFWILPRFLWKWEVSNRKYSLIHYQNNPQTCQTLGIPEFPAKKSDRSILSIKFMCHRKEHCLLCSLLSP